MLPTDLPMSAFLGKSALFYAGMNGAKTAKLYSSLDMGRRAGLNARAFVSTLNSPRDGLDCLRINEGVPIPAKSVTNSQEIRGELSRLERLLFSREPSYIAEKIKDPTDGEEYILGKPIEVVGIDELHLLCLTPKQTEEMLELVDQCRKEGRAVFQAALLEDFRGSYFGGIDVILRRTDYGIPTYARCKVDLGEKHCGEPATHTHKLWNYELLSPEMQSLLADVPKVGWWTKNEKLIRGNHVVAPYFAPTVQIELRKNISDEEKQFVYIPSCNKCWRELPYTRETFSVYNATFNGADSRNVLGNNPLTEAIVGFLISENWVKSKDGVLVPNPGYRNIVGGYSPHNGEGK